MAPVNQAQKEMPQNLRTKLALAVRSVQWSYAIFWSISSTQTGALEWCEGYYNGDIKTRKTVQAAEVNMDQLGWQRSDQLRELYESLALGETEPQAKRPTVALSPEDLTDTEWYFLVCMSFLFDTGQGLPGRSLAKNKMIWLCDAHWADTKVFSRSLLAKSASIQTVVCFPHLGGVVELGTTELVTEDPNLVQHIKSFLESPEIVSKIPKHVFNSTSSNMNLTRERPVHLHMPEEGHGQVLDDPHMKNCSPNNSGDFADNLLRDESKLVEGVDGEASQIQSWPVMDDAISNCLNNSMTSSDCISQTHDIPLSEGKTKKKGRIHGNQECYQQKTPDIQDNDVHYHSVLSNLLKSSHQLTLGPYTRKGNRESSFSCWRKDGIPRTRVPQRGIPQKLLKKVLFEVGRMHVRLKAESGKPNGDSKREVDDIDRSHVLSERKRREKINERFLVLESLVPSGGKVDKVSVLDHTIEYLRGLERKVEELEAYKEAMERESTTPSKSQDVIERTSDNYGSDKPEKPVTNKRKACDKGKVGADQSSKVRLRDSSTDNIAVSVSDKNVLIKISCAVKEHALLEVMETLSKMHLETLTIQSSTTDGILSITVNAKCTGLKSPPAGVIRQVLHKVIRKC